MNASLLSLVTTAVTEDEAISRKRKQSTGDPDSTSPCWRNSRAKYEPQSASSSQVTSEAHGALPSAGASRFAAVGTDACSRHTPALGMAHMSHMPAFNNCSQQLSSGASGVVPSLSVNTEHREPCSVPAPPCAQTNSSATLGASSLESSPQHHHHHHHQHQQQQQQHRGSGLDTGERAFQQFRPFSPSPLFQDQDSVQEGAIPHEGMGPAVPARWRSLHWTEQGDSSYGGVPSKSGGRSSGTGRSSITSRHGAGVAHSNTTRFGSPDQTQTQAQVQNQAQPQSQTHARSLAESGADAGPQILPLPGAFSGNGGARDRGSQRLRRLVTQRSSCASAGTGRSCLGSVSAQTKENVELGASNCADSPSHEEEDEEKEEEEEEEEDEGDGTRQEGLDQGLESVGGRGKRRSQGSGTGGCSVGRVEARVRDKRLWGDWGEGQERRVKCPRLNEAPVSSAWDFPKHESPSSVLQGCEGAVLHSDVPEPGLCSSLLYRSGEQALVKGGECSSQGPQGFTVQPVKDSCPQRNPAKVGMAKDDPRNVESAPALVTFRDRQSDSAADMESSGRQSGVDTDASLSDAQCGDAPLFVLSSGRTRNHASKSKGIGGAPRQPTIDDEFEQYFAQMLL